MLSFLAYKQRNNSLDHISDITCVDVARTSVTLSSNVKLLDITIDFNLVLNKYASSICQASY